MTKHFKNKRDAIKKWFQNKYRRRIDKRFEKRTNQYIFAYEKVVSKLIENDKNDKMNEMNHDMTTLIIDVLFFEAFNTTTFHDEAFIISFEMIKDVESNLSNLMNWSFKHSLTRNSSQFTKNKTQNSFVYVINDPYSFN